MVRAETPSPAAMVLRFVPVMRPATVLARRAPRAEHLTVESGISLSYAKSPAGFKSTEATIRRRQSRVRILSARVARLTHSTKGPGRRYLEAIRETALARA